MEFEFKILANERYADLRYLFKVVFQKNVSIDYLKRKYNTEHTGLQYVCYLAYVKDKPVGFYGIIPQIFEQDGQQLIGVHACDFITHPDYRGQKLSRKLGLKAYGLCKEKGVKFVYGFQSEPSYASGKNLGWTDYAQFEVYERKVDAFPLITICNRLGFQSWYQKFSSKVLKPNYVETYTNSNASLKNALYVKYDQSFLNYKSFSNNHLISIGDINCWIKLSNNLVVGDININSKNELLNGIKNLKKIAQKLGCTKIIIQAFPNTILHEILKETTYQAQKSWVVGYKILDEHFTLKNLFCNAVDFDTF